MGEVQSTESIASDESSIESQHPPDLKANLADVLILLANFNSSNVPIPLLLVVEILNYAGILAPVRVHRGDRFTSTNDCNSMYVTLKLPSNRYVRPTAIHLNVSSKDQGWSSYPSERGMRSSHTWGELCLSNKPAQRFSVFRNIHAGRSFEEQTVNIPLSEAAPEQYKPLIRDILSFQRDSKSFVNCYELGREFFVYVLTCA